MSPRAACAFVVVCAFGLAGSPLAAAQEAPAPKPPREAPSATATHATLQARLAELTREITAERARGAAARTAAAAAIAERESRRDALAAEVLDLELARLRAARSLRDATTPIDADDDAVARALERLFGAAAEATGTAEVLARELPGGAAFAASFADAALALAPGQPSPNQPSPSQPSTKRFAAAVAVADSLRAFVADASRIHSRAVTVRTESGVEETVDLLSIGHVGFLYRVPGTDRVGIALQSPADAAGFRWTEAVSTGERELVSAAFRDTEADTETVIAPLDVSGRLALQARTQAFDVSEWMDSGGPVMVPLLALLIVAGVIGTERMIALALLRGAGSKPLAAVLEAAARGDLDAARASVADTKGSVSRSLAACLRAAGAGQTAMEDAAQGQLLEEQPRLSRRLRGLAVIAAVSPLLGLFGTVTGIIDAFSVIRVYGNTEPGLMAGGIAEALVTTAAGLVVAIPALLLHSYLAGRADTVLADAEQACAQLLCTWREGAAQRGADDGSRTAAPPPTESSS